MKTVVLIMLLCFLLCSCTTYKYLRSPLDANHRPITDHAEILLRSGARIDAVNIRVSVDSTQYFLSESNAFGKIGTNEIERLKVTDHLAGGVGGFVAGCLGGIVGGILVGKIAGVPSSGEAAMGMIGFVAGGFAIGSISGLIYGANRGYQLNYIFPPDTAKSAADRIPSR